MKILAIETSCDETAVSILDITGPREKPEVKLLGNSLLSQIELHKEYGGVYPNLAKREHQKNLPPLLEKTLTEAGLDWERPDIDFIAVTAGPGLEPALWVGITFAQELGKRWDKPVLGTNHMEGHIYSVLYQNIDNEAPTANIQLKLPAIALLVSGGHTELVYIKDFCDYKILGKTRDDAVGEAFDKVARLLGLPYPGGPKVSELAAIDRMKNKPGIYKFTRPMLHSKDLDFSYSGLKTSVLYKVKELGLLTENMKEALARAFEDAAIGVLVEKTRDALLQYPVKTLLIGGGVSANVLLRKDIQKLKEEFDIDILLPSRELTGDNAVMIGLAAYIRVLTYPNILNQSSNLIAKGNLSLEI